ncbi:RagB/SusD family nutrient uptake outer membrane protein [Chitinophagaceae bacterium LWZ2-11]
MQFNNNYRKNKNKLALFVITASLMMAACNKNYLNQLPVTSLVPQTAFITYNNFETYAWGLYGYMNGYGSTDAQYPDYMGSQEFNSDNLSQTFSQTSQSPYATQLKIVPVNGSATTELNIGGWDFSYVRKVNVMLDAIGQSSMVQADKDHWRSVGYFFRALRYYDLIAAFGDVPWIEHSLTDTSASILYGPRTPRDSVAQNILNNLIWADAHIKPGGDGVNTINTNVVDALISRFGLFEGTWRKYHGLSNANIYLQACKTYSEKLFSSMPNNGGKPKIMSSYDDVYNTEDLTGQPGIILFKKYAAGLMGHGNPRYNGSTSWNADVTKDAVQSYLCTDGKPISTSAVFQGDNTMNNEFRQRDRRLYFTVLPPYKVTIGSPATTWSYTGNALDREFMDTMNNLPGNANKKLPVSAQSITWTTGLVISTSPHFFLFNAGQPQWPSQLGYYYWKPHNILPMVIISASPLGGISGSTNAQSTNDCPLFRIEETMLNYAEAMFELSSFNQSVADLTINVLRSRANVAAMNVANINASFDLNRDQTVDPVLWEIRRERRVELFGDGFRFNDLKRWLKGTYLNKQQIGVTVKNADFGNKLSIVGGAATGPVQYFPAPVGWLDKYYLEPIPSQEIALNPNLKPNNPGWQ